MHSFYLSVGVQLLSQWWYTASISVLMSGLYLSVAASLRTCITEIHEHVAGQPNQQVDTRAGQSFDCLLDRQWGKGRDSSLLVGCLTSQQQASVSQGRICSDKFTCCHTEIEVADQTFYLTQSQYTDTGPTSPSADPITPGAWQGSHWSANFEVTGMSRPRKNPRRKQDSNPESSALYADALPLGQPGGKRFKTCAFHCSSCLHSCSPLPITTTPTTRPPCHASLLLLPPRWPSG